MRVRVLSSGLAVLFSVHAAPALAGLNHHIVTGLACPLGTALGDGCAEALARGPVSFQNPLLMTAGAYTGITTAEPGVQDGGTNVITNRSLTNTLWNIGGGDFGLGYTLATPLKNPALGGLPNECKYNATGSGAPTPGPKITCQHQASGGTGSVPCSTITIGAAGSGAVILIPAGGPVSSIPQTNCLVLDHWDLTNVQLEVTAGVGSIDGLATVITNNKIRTGLSEIYSAGYDVQVDNTGTSLIYYGNDADDNYPSISANTGGFPITGSDLMTGVFNDNRTGCTTACPTIMWFNVTNNSRQRPAGGSNAGDMDFGGNYDDGIALVGQANTIQGSVSDDGGGTGVTLTVTSLVGVMPVRCNMQGDTRFGGGIVTTAQTGGTIRGAGTYTLASAVTAGTITTSTCGTQHGEEFLQNMATSAVQANRVKRYNVIMAGSNSVDNPPNWTTAFYQYAGATATVTADTVDHNITIINQGSTGGYVSSSAVAQATTSTITTLILTNNRSYTHGALTCFNNAGAGGSSSIGTLVQPNGSNISFLDGSAINGLSINSVLGSATCPGHH